MILVTKRPITVAFLILAVLTAAGAVIPHLEFRSDSPIIHSVAVGLYPAALAVDAHRSHVFVTSFSTGTVSMIDTRTGALLQTMQVGLQPVAVVADTATGRVFVTSEGDPLNPNVGSTVSVLSADTGLALSSVAVGKLGPQDDIAVDEKSSRVFVANYGNRTVTMLDARDGTILHVVRTGSAPYAVAVLPHLRRAFVTNQGDGTVAVLDTHDASLLRTIRVGGNPSVVVADPGIDRIVVVSQWLGGIHEAITIIDARRLKIVKTIVGGLAGLFAAAVDSHNHRVFFSASDADNVIILDVRTGRLRSLVHVGRQPYSIAVDARTGRVFVINGNSESLSVLDARTGRVRHTFVLAPQPGIVGVDETTGHVFVGSAGGTGVAPDPWRSVRQWLPPRLVQALPFLPRLRTRHITFPPSVATIDEKSL